jgi:replicative DNA helicase Mcm
MAERGGNPGAALDAFGDILGEGADGEVPGGAFPDGEPAGLYHRRVRGIRDRVNPFRTGQRRGVSLPVRMEHLTHVSPALASLVYSDPTTALGRMADKFREAVLDVHGEEMGNLEDWIPYFHVRVHGIDDYHHIKIRDLGSFHIEKLVKVTGLITRISEIKPLLRRGTYRCPRCLETFEVVQDRMGQYRSPASVHKRCPNPECNNRKMSSMTLLEHLSDLIDWQMAYLQEPPEDLPPGTTPKGIELVFTDDYVERVSPGVRVEVTGILHFRPDFNPGKSDTSRDPIFDKFIEVVHIKTISEEERGEEITQADEDRIRELASREDIEDLIVNSVATSMYGYREIKHAIAMLAVGGVEHHISGEGRDERGDLNILLAGDPSTGKSQFLTYAKQLSPQRYAYASGKKSTAAGLTAGMVKDGRTGVLTLEAGAVVYASGGICAIDEFDKVDGNDLDSLLEVMVSQSVTINKAGINATMPAKCAILAAMNPKYLRYRPDLSFAENMDLEETISSRFDLIFLMLDNPEPEFDDEFADHILRMFDDDRESGDGEGEAESADQASRDGLWVAEDPDGAERLPRSKLMKYIRYAQERVRPQMTAAARDKAKEYYLQMRAASYGGMGDALIADRRTLSTIRRVAEANARLCLRSEVTVHDIDVAYNLYQYSLRQIAVDDMGNPDLDAIRGLTKSKRDITVKVFKLLKELEREADSTEEYSRRTGVPLGRILDRALSEGVIREQEGVDVEEKLRSVLDTLYDRGDVYKPKDGTTDSESTFKTTRLRRKVRRG